MMWTEAGVLTHQQKTGVQITSGKNRFTVGVYLGVCLGVYVCFFFSPYHTLHPNQVVAPIVREYQSGQRLQREGPSELRSGMG